MVFSLVVGIGIFRTPAIVARAAGSTAVFFTAWILAGVVSLIGAFVFAEIGARHPRAGGYYRVVADCYHPALAFMLNWSQTLMQGAGAAGVAFIGADYLAPMVLPAAQVTPHTKLVVACVSMLVLLALNYRGVRMGARAQNVLSVLKIALMAALVICAFVLGAHGAPARAMLPVAHGSSVLRLATARVLGSFGTWLDDLIRVDTVTLAVVASTLFVLRRRSGGAAGFALWGDPLFRFGRRLFGTGA